MTERISRREFVGGSVLTSATMALALGARAAGAAAPAASPGDAPAAAEGQTAVPRGRIGKLEIGRLLLGGNLLTHYTHSRDLQYVYNLTAHYNTEQKILETLACAEQHGVNTLCIHVVDTALRVLRQHRDRGGAMQWIICPTAEIDDSLKAYAAQVKQLVQGGTQAIYLWGVRADQLAAQGRADLIAKAVAIAKDHGVPSGVGAHDLNVIRLCEDKQVGADFYIKTLHHHQYATAPKPEQLKGPHSEIPGYWCREPEETVAFMRGVAKPWIAFKVMAAGAIPPKSGFEYAFRSGADFVLAGMFDFEIRMDAQLVRGLLARDMPRERPWRA